jgi:hypothetical protein
MFSLEECELNGDGSEGVGLPAGHNAWILGTNHALTTDFACVKEYAKK